MKKFFRLTALLMIAGGVITLSAQTVTVHYMKVNPGMEDAYRQVEQEWKEFHQKRIDAGLLNGWQLWRVMYAGTADPYNYVTVEWYDDWAHSFAEAPEGFWEEANALFSEDLMERTMKAREMVDIEVSHGIHSANNNHGGQYIRVNRMKVMPGMWDDYMTFEEEIIKPMFEEAIGQGLMANWGVWQNYPYNEGDIRVITVDGFDNSEQLLGGVPMQRIFSEVHPDKDVDQETAKLGTMREMASVEIWQLQDIAWEETED